MDTNGSNPVDESKSEKDELTTDQQAADSAPEPASGEDTQKQVEELNRRADDNWEKFVRAQAEIENMRKRNARDIEQARMYAVEKFVLEMLTVKDSLELGLEKADADKEKLYEGMSLTLKLLNQIFEKFEVKEIVPKGEVFNPDEHQAMMMKPDSDNKPGTVLEVMQKGYSLSGRLIRPAMVSVAEKADNGKKPE